MAASVLGLAAIGVADRNTLAGVVRMHDAASRRETDASRLRLLVGAACVFRDGTPDMLCYPPDRAAWGRLTRLLSVGKLRAKHGDASDAAKATNRCFLDYADLLAHGEGQVLIVVPPHRLDAAFARACRARRGGFSRSRLCRRHPPPSRRRCAPAARARRAWRADGRHQRRALPRPRAAAAAGRADLHPPAAASTRRAARWSPTPSAT